MVHFLAPSLLLALAAAALPALIHLIGRRRARPVRFAAMELLLRAERQVSARRRLRDVLLLLARTSIAAALPFVFARPFTERPSDVPASASRPQTAIIVLDDSASLRRRAPRGGTVFEAARDKVRELVRHFAAESDAALVLASEGTPAPVAEPTTDRGRLLGAIGAASCSARPADFASALRRAAQIASGSERRERRIYVFTDLQRTGWQEGDGADALAHLGTPVTLIDAGGDAWNNRAVLDVTTRPAPELGAHGVEITAEIANFSDRPADALPVILTIDGGTVARGSIDLPAGGRARKRFVHALGGVGAGRLHVADVRIEGGDPFALDDRRAALIEAARGLRALVIDGDARTVRTEDETYFLETALEAGGARFQVTTALPEDVGGRPLGGYGVVFIANLAAPTPELAAALARYVEAGGGLFVSVGDHVDADAWNARAGRLLAQPLGLRRTAAAAPGSSREGETVDTRPAERLAPIDRKHPLLTAFPAEGQGLASARFFQYFLLAPAPDAPGRSVILRFESGAPALVESDLGRGRVMLLATTVDRDWTDLPIRPGFLPLIQEAARRLAGAPARDAVAAALVGQPHTLALDPDDTRIEVTRPDGRIIALTRESLPRGGRELTFTDTDEPGLYTVRAAGTSGSLAGRADDAFVVTLDPRESDPALLPPDKRPDRATAAASAGDAPKRRVELWHALAAAVVFLVLGESLLTLRIGRLRARRT